MPVIATDIESSGDDEAQCVFSAATATNAKADQAKPSSLSFSNPFSHRKRSSTSIYQRQLPTTPDSDRGEIVTLESAKSRHLTRTRSEDITPRVREVWAAEVWRQEGLQESALLLSASAAEYQREATHQQWKDLLRINADIAELGKLADDARQDRRAGKDYEAGTVDGLSKFTAVALEYSKMLDVVMNQSPEYAGIAWGAIRMLLVAHTNNSKLKNAVEEQIIHFGQEFGLVNQIMSYHPTQKMVHAVSEAYAAFYKFLAKSVKYYKESKLKSAIKAFAFPYETRFQTLSHRIDMAFKRIKEIAQAGHFGMSVQTQQMVESIDAGQREMRTEMRQNTLTLREQLKLELRNEVQDLFQSFDRNWISRFERIMIESTKGHDAIQSRQAPKALQVPLEQIALEYADSIMETSTAPSRTLKYLADYVLKPKKLKRFRDRSFPLLQKLDFDDDQMNARLRRLATPDLQQIMGLLRNEKVRAWLQATLSHFIWINTFKRSGPADWATAFAVKMIEYAGHSQNITVLYHFCGNHASKDEVSTPFVLIQSLVMQLTQQHYGQFVRKDALFSLEHFQDIRDDVDDLWDLFLKMCAETRAACIWIVIDNFDNLQKGEGYEAVLQNLLRLVQSSSGVFKTFISARTSGTPAEVSKAMSSDEQDESHDRITAVTVPRASSSMSSAILAKHKRFTRLPEIVAPRDDDASTSKVNLDSLLHSSSEDEGGSTTDKPPAQFDDSPIVVMSSPEALHRSGFVDDSMAESSDSGMEFARKHTFDPFATSSEESDFEPSIRKKHDPESDLEDFSFATEHKQRDLDSGDLFGPLNSDDAHDSNEMIEGKGKSFALGDDRSRSRGRSTRQKLRPAVVVHQKSLKGLDTSDSDL